MAPSLQLATEKVNLKFLASMRERELQLENIPLKLPDEETAETVSAGSADKEVQLANIEFTSVTAAVLNNGMWVKLLQLINIPLIFVTAVVLNGGTVLPL